MNVSRFEDAMERVSGPAGASFSSRAQLEEILAEAFATPATPLTEARKQRIAEQADRVDSLGRHELDR
jgi:hypothetical protein